STRATLATLIVALFVGGLNWFVVGMCCYVPLAWALPRTGMERPVETLVRFHAYGLTPPVTLGWLARSGNEFESDRYWRSREAKLRTASALWGLGVWWLAAGGLYAAGSVRFRRLSGRRPLNRRREPRPAVPVGRDGVGG